MSAAAILCGKRSNYFFEDFQSSPSSSSSSPPVPKRIRCFSSSFSAARSNFDYDHSFSAVNIFSGSSVSSSSALDHLLTLFPAMDKQLVERALEECGDDLDSAIKGLNELRLGSGENPRSVAEAPVLPRIPAASFLLKVQLHIMARPHLQRIYLQQK